MNREKKKQTKWIAGVKYRARVGGHEEMRARGHEERDARQEKVKEVLFNLSLPCVFPSSSAPLY